MIWSPQQEAALREAKAWLADPSRQVFRLFGFAGTGKSTLAKELGAELGNVIYAAFTGKAADVMRKRGCVGATTIHSLIYNLKPTDPENPPEKDDPIFVLNEHSDVRDADLVIIDEVSMVDAPLAMDLLSFKTKVLVLGDPFQLPPVKGSGFFTGELNVPNVMLTEIHRQAADNPIIRMSMDVREGRGLELGTYGDSKVIKRDAVDQAEVMAAGQVLVGRNASRTRYNARMREIQGHADLVPRPGERLVCLRNCAHKGLLNGQLFDVASARRWRGGKIGMQITRAGEEGVEPIPVTTHEAFFTGAADNLEWKVRRELQEFDYGYALTVHKAQGSQWDDVYLFDESQAFREHSRRWLYTGITRAAERITVAL